MKDKKQGTGHTVLTRSILVVLGIFLVSAGLLCRSLYEYRKGEKEYGLLQRYAAKAPGREPESRSPYSLSAGEQEPMLAVDFEALKKLNPHIIAWIHIPGTPVSYPVTQGEDNSYYLNRTFSKAYNGAGCIFVDYRSSLPSEGGNTVLYGHNMKNGSMFGSLKRYWDNEYYREHSSFYLYTAEGEIFLCHITDRRRISAQTDFFSEMQDKEEEPGEDGKTDRDARVILVTCVAGKNEERLAIEADAKKIFVYWQHKQIASALKNLI
ncbi:class B sortase [Enterocloster clostridioformis]|uniref:class B sortase n=1 Tax=Enterocloster clostridioformis TaxID=1531 RepID=UPI00080C65C7|nr:class B sortase [Enterocloster clostridioformis]ANU45521.1 class B sortase [Lachnoclostridium sp. YL32]NDO27290.1 class B sortase [Enterocloster clostridioformis]OXE61578.1 class B sortase [Enterocloster clostridioformis]QQQ99723.1 class B sortase [Enterocloster clostridioformis]